MTPIEEKLMMLRREILAYATPDRYRFASLFSIFDEVVIEATGKERRSCPICGDELERIDLGQWECTGLYHGAPITFREGVRNCPHCKRGGPYCSYTGYCLSKRFVAYGKPTVCIIGRIDDQSPK